MITLIIGPQRSGKTAKAAELCKGLNCVSLTTPVSTKKSITEVIVFDDVVKHEFKDIFDFCNQNTISFKNPFFFMPITIQISLPEIIITTQDESAENYFNYDLLIKTKL